jgi:hypothetical protein
MAKGSAGSAGGIASGLIIGGFLCLGLILLGIAATIVLSLISTFTSNNSVDTYGEEYQVTLLLKVIHQNTTYTFKNGTVADNTALSTLCGTVYRKASSANSYAACIATNFNAYGTYNDSSTAKRRRRANTANGTYGSYLPGLCRHFYSHKCQGTTNAYTYSNSTSIPSCISQRLAQCNAFFNSTGALKAWTPLANSFSVSAVESTGSTYVELPVLYLYSVPSSSASSYGSTLGLSSQTISELSIGCRYIGAISQAAIAAAIAAQASATTAAPTTVVVG